MKVSLLKLVSFHISGWAVYNMVCSIEEKRRIWKKLGQLLIETTLGPPCNLTEMDIFDV
jgi:hypothetical protein